MLEPALGIAESRFETPEDIRVDVGGQAVIEGVMMRAPRSLAVAVRKPTGEIVLKEQEWRSLSERLPFLKWPVLRGCVVFAEALINGIQALSFSAAQSEGAGEEEASPLTIGLTMLLGIVLAILLFVVLPHLLSGYLLAMYGPGYGLTSFTFHALDGAVKVLLFLSYILGISLLRDVRRLFQYHGAEHKSILAYEAGAELSVAGARPFPRLHPRCGTSFLILVMLISIFCFSAAFAVLPGARAAGSWYSLPYVGLKIILMLPVAGIAYETIRFCSRRMDHALARLIVLPGLLLQRLTTREPSDDQLEIALRALASALAMERAKELLRVP
jgi:uncharacterized protein YqhQ